MYCSEIIYIINTHIEVLLLFLKMLAVTIIIKGAMIVYYALQVKSWDLFMSIYRILCRLTQCAANCYYIHLYHCSWRSGSQALCWQKQSTIWFFLWMVSWSSGRPLNLVYARRFGVIEDWVLDGYKCWTLVSTRPPGGTVLWCMHQLATSIALWLVSSVA